MGFDVSGLNEFTKQLADLEGDTFTIQQRLLDAGSPEVADVWVDELDKVIMPKGTPSAYYRHRKNGSLYRVAYISRSTGETKASVDYDNAVSYSDIYPKGKDSKGVRNAEKAFILNYGRKNMAEKNYLDNISDKAVSVAVPAMQKELNEILKEKGLV